MSDADSIGVGRCVLWCQACTVPKSYDGPRLHFPPTADDLERFIYALTSPTPKVLHQRYLLDIMMGNVSAPTEKGKGKGESKGGYAQDGVMNALILGVWGRGKRAVG